MGTAAWAYYITMVPIERSKEPLLIFDVAASYVTRILCPLPRNPQYAFMKMYASHLQYIPITVLGVVNLSAPGISIPVYSGQIGFF
jgi:hypothetical protein